MPNTSVSTLHPYEINTANLPRIARERRDRYISSLKRINNHECTTLVEPLPDESVYSQMDALIHELIHADDDVNGRADWSNVVDRARSESKAYAHSPRTWCGNLHDAFYYSLREHICTLDLK